jgi:AraC-like DNA-binding protein
VTGREPVTCPYHAFAPARELRDHLLCFWTVGPHSGGSETVLPDGSIDVVWREGRGPVIAGPDTGPVPSTRPAGATVVGASFRPGAAPAMLGIPADELRDLRVPFTELWGGDAERLEYRLDGAASSSTRLRLMQEELRGRLKRAQHPDRLVGAAVAQLHQAGLTRVGAIGERFGISERQLRRRFNAAVGYGPKTLARVLRFQRMLALARERATIDLGKLALDAGYADQAHMTAECSRVAGAPPARLIAERYLVSTTA